MITNRNSGPDHHSDPSFQIEEPGSKDGASINARHHCLSQAKYFTCHERQLQDSASAFSQSRMAVFDKAYDIINYSALAAALWRDEGTGRDFTSVPHLNRRVLVPAPVMEISTAAR
jgi:hypothetical protein